MRVIMMMAMMAMMAASMVSLRVLVVDDLLATGGTASACMQLAKSLGAEISGLGFVVELDFLNGRKKFSPNEISEFHFGEGSELTDRSGLRFRTKYRDQEIKRAKAIQAKAKVAAKAAGRPYPNLVDNIRAARSK